MRCFPCLYICLLHAHQATSEPEVNTVTVSDTVSVLRGLTPQRRKKMFQTACRFSHLPSHLMTTLNQTVRYNTQTFPASYTFLFGMMERQPQPSTWYLSGQLTTHADPLWCLQTFNINNNNRPVVVSTHCVPSTAVSTVPETSGPQPQNRIVPRSKARKLTL